MKTFGKLKVEYPELYNDFNKIAEEIRNIAKLWDVEEAKEIIDVLTKKLEGLKPNLGKYVVGYQVTRDGENGVEIHPNMDDSFCIYSELQAYKMISNSKPEDGWEISPVYNGEIEEPTFMFKF